MKLRTWVLTAISAAVISTPAFATTVNGVFDNTSPIWSGPDPTLPFYQNTTYRAFSFTTPASSSLTFTLTLTNGLDGVLSLYSGTFNPASPSTNRVQLSDGFSLLPYVDGGFANDTETAFVTTVGTPIYTIVVSGNTDDPSNSPVGNSSFGSYSLNISPNVIAVPEPAEWAMMLAGLGLVGAIVRHRRRSW